MALTLTGYVFDNSGNAIPEATVQGYVSADNASTTAGDSVTTDANGKWTITTSTATQIPMDVKITYGSNVRWIKAGDEINVESLTVTGELTVGEDGTGFDVTLFGDTPSRSAVWDQSEDALQLNDNTELKFGSLAAGDMVLYHDGSDSYIKNATGALKLATESTGIAVTIGHTTSEVTIADNLTVAGTLTLSSGLLDVSGLELLAGVTAGTVTASKAVVVDANKDVASFRNLTATGALTGGSLDIEGGADVNGATDLDDTDIDGTLVVDGSNISLDSTATLNIDNSNTSNGITIGTATSGVPVTIGHGTSMVTIGDNLTVTGDLTVSGTQTVVNTVTMNAANAVVFEGATADEHETTLTIENPTADRTVVIPNVSGTLAILAADSDVAITSTPAELNLLDGVSGLVQADFTKLAAVDATAAEIDLLDGSEKSTASITIDDADAFIIIDGNTTKQIPASDLAAYVTSEGSMNSFQLEDDSGDEVTINNANEIKFIGSGIDINWTDTDNGTDGDPYDLTFTLDFSDLSTVTPVDGDFFATLDSDGANEQKTSTTALATLFAGTSLTANSSVISVDDDFLRNDVNDTTAGVVTAAGFTVGSMVLTDGVVTDTSGLSVVAATTVTGALTVGVDDTGHDVKFFGASAGAYMEYDQSADQLRIMGASADAVTSTGKLLLATSLTDINANDVIGKIDFQAPHEAGGTDAITVAASIQAIAQGTFSASVNATDLIFYTGHSEAATEKFRVTSQGELGIGGANYGTDGQVFTSAGAGAAPAWEDAGGGGGSDVQAFTSGGTWTKPDGVATVLVVLHSAGGGGGSGRVGASSSTRAGGGGGGGAGLRMRAFTASTLGGTETVTVGSGGAGGAAQTTDNTNGSAGSTGGASSFGAWLADSGGRGGGGPAGTAASGNGGSGGTGTDAGGVGGVAGVGSANDAATGNSGGGGGAGGGIHPSGNTTRDGGGGGQANFLSATAAAGGDRDTTDNGVTPTASGYGGSGSGGSQSNTTGNGGAGASPGGGGGGSGGATNGYDTGAGGAGGAGRITVYSW